MKNIDNWYYRSIFHCRLIGVVLSLFLILMIVWGVGLVVRYRAMEPQPIPCYLVDPPTSKGEQE